MSTSCLQQEKQTQTHVHHLGDVRSGCPVPYDQAAQKDGPYAHRILFSHKKGGNPLICDIMDKLEGMLNKRSKHRKTRTAQSLLYVQFFLKS
jgi:hypothetical protein